MSNYKYLAMNERGNLTIPKPIREELNLKETGEMLAIKIQGDSLIIRRAVTVLKEEENK